MIPIAVLASTKGTDLQAIMDAIKNKTLLVNLSCVISNKKDCFALKRAKNEGIKTFFLDPKGKEREEYDKEIHEILEKRKVSLVVLVGYMRFLSPWFVKKYKNRIINVHPSLLPSFPGMDLNVHQEVLEYGCKVSGCTFFFVDEGKDSGPIIYQEAVKIEENETVDSLKTKVQESEKKAMPHVIRLFAENRLKVSGRKVKIL